MPEDNQGGGVVIGPDIGHVEPEHHTETDGISWTASEYISHQKNGGWYVGLVAVAAVIAVAVFLLTGDKISTAMMVIVAIVFGIFASRQPRTLRYSISDGGLQIENKHYPFEMFKSFSIDDDGPLVSIYLTPLKRFLPGLTIYFPPDQEEQIITAFSDYLPHEERPPDALDKLMRKIRF